VANGAASLPIAWRLYLPQAWAEDAELRRKVKIPAQIALEQIRTAKIQGIAPGVVLADAGYGADGGFRTGLTDLDLTYVLGAQPTLSVWRPGEGQLPPKPWSGKGRPPSRSLRTDDHKRSRPRNSPDPTRTARPDLHRDHPPTSDRRPGQSPLTMSMLHPGDEHCSSGSQFVAQ